MGIIRTSKTVAENSRRFECFLHVHSEFDDVQEELKLRLRLVVGSRRSEGNIRLSIFDRERRINRLSRSLAGNESVHIIRVEIEIRHPVVEEITGILDDHSTTERAQQT